MASSASSPGSAPDRHRAPGARTMKARRSVEETETQVPPRDRNRTAGIVLAALFCANGRTLVDGVHAQEPSGGASVRSVHTAEGDAVVAQDGRVRVPEKRGKPGG